MSEVMLSEIRIGTRHRKHLGDIPALAKSIEEIGLLHPVVVTPKLDLIAGRRRLEAVKKLGWDRIPVHMIDLKEIVRGEFAENALRKDLTPSEAVAIGKALEALEKKKATERQQASRAKKGQKIGAGNLPAPGELPAEKGQVRDRVAAGVGMSATTYEHAKKVVEAAEADPEGSGHLVEEMDRTGNVHAAYTAIAQPEGCEDDEAEQYREQAHRFWRGVNDFWTLVEEFKEDQDVILNTISQMSRTKQRRLWKRLRELHEPLWRWGEELESVLENPTPGAAAGADAGQG
jgi:ParB/RepB/Spo0J family partition protein